MAAVSPAPIKFNFLKLSDVEECFSFESVCMCVCVCVCFWELFWELCIFENSEIRSFMIL